LTRDPLYRALLVDRKLPSEGKLIDIGCGSGLALAMLAAAQVRLQLWGLDRRAGVAETARRALGSDATIVTGDLRDTDLPRCDVALVCDVLHLVSRADQDQLLTRAIEALEPGGVLVLREADASAGWRFHAVRIGNSLVAASRGHFRPTFHFRTADEWRRELEARGLQVEVRPSGAKMFGNVLLYGYSVSGRTIRNSPIQTIS
jgi:trans-aconitate methyltransferase